ncbi:hypothetical protein SeV_D0004 (plasmid) [Salmonella enterica subsp. enterica serovar Virchow str. SL491]|uniref:Uncharacterized protein n=1 Tax=Salmonella virchow (strain SL491) TaxID=465517 RepID=A0A6C7A4G1_SALV4|nr:hypothetical protein SeV_D0004 [Salmonella enterica subsp. enterica serovar Virchow str. SL491]
MLQADDFKRKNWNNFILKTNLYLDRYCQDVLKFSYQKD